MRRQFVRYVAIGVGLNLVFYVAYLLLSWRLLGSEAAMTVTSCVGTLGSFFANRKLTFAHRGDQRAALLRFLACYGLLYALDFAALWVFSRNMGIAHQLVQGGVILVLPWIAFVLQKFWVFPPEAPV